MLALIYIWRIHVRIVGVNINQFLCELQDNKLQDFVTGCWKKNMELLKNLKVRDKKNILVTMYNLPGAYTEKQIHCKRKKSIGHEMGHTIEPFSWPIWVIKRPPIVVR